MKTIGLLGGMSWESTVSYYQNLNVGIKQRLGDLNSAKLVLYSVNFEEIEKFQSQNEWEMAAELLSDAASSLEAAGADFMLICTNTMHKVAPQIEDTISIPLIHIADATAERLLLDGIKKVGLLGTRFTMEEDFYKARIAEKFGIEVVIPDQNDRQLVHQVIYEELCLGEINETSRIAYLEIIDRLTAQGAEAVILGCTEIALLINQDHSEVKLYDTTAIHCQKAIDLSLS